MNKELKKINAVVRYVDEYRPNLRTIETDEYKIAKKLRYEHDDHYFGAPGELIDITVNGVTFTAEDL